MRSTSIKYHIKNTKKKMKYELLEYQQNILSKKVNSSQINILQRNSIPRVKEKVINQQLFYHSSNEENQNIRVLVFAFLAKMYSHYSLKHQEQLDHFKSIVYDSKPPVEITSSRGLEEGQLFHCFADHFRQIIVGQRAEAFICSIMNNFSLIQELVFSALEQELTKQGYSSSQTMEVNVTKWLFNEFAIQVKIIPESDINQEQNQNQMFLFIFDQHFHRKSYEQIRRISLNTNSTIEITMMEQVKMLDNGENRPNAQEKQIFSPNHYSYIEEMSPLVVDTKRQPPVKSSMDNSGWTKIILSPVPVKKGLKKQMKVSAAEKLKEYQQQTGDKKKPASIFSIFCCCD